MSSFAASGWRRLAIAAVLVLVAVAAVGFIANARARSAKGGEIRGVRLGMTVRDVRARFDAQGAGQWESSVADDLVLKWKPADGARTGPLSAQLEFHAGLLMAIRADVAAGDPAAAGPSFDLTEASVTTRENDAKGIVHVTTIARSCPTHAKEAEALINAGSRGGGRRPGL